MSRKDAARHVGAHIRTAIDWDNGMRRSNELRLGRDGRIMGCHKDVTTLISRRTRLAAVDQQLDPRILSLSRENRYAISRPRGLDQIPRRSPLAITIDDQLGTTAEGLEAEIAGTAARLRLGRTAHSLVTGHWSRSATLWSRNIRPMRRYACHRRRSTRRSTWRLEVSRRTRRRRRCALGGRDANPTVPVVATTVRPEAHRPLGLRPRNP